MIKLGKEQTFGTQYNCDDCDDTTELENGESCQSCCPHAEYDHDICLDCGYERDPGEAIDAAEYTYGDDL